MSDCWIVEKARTSSNKYEAEAWMLVAKTVGSAPDLSLAAFEINCAKENAVEAADCLQKLYMSAANDRFWDEVSKIVSVFRERISTPETEFRRKILLSLHKDVQQSLLLDLADRCIDSLDKTFLHLLLLSFFPQSAAAFGMELLTTLQSGFVDVTVDSLSQNLHAQLLVTEAVCPLLQCEALPIPDDLSMGIVRQVLIMCLSTISNKQSFSSETPISSETAGRIEAWLESPWKCNPSILQLFTLFATKHKWKGVTPLTQTKFDKPNAFIASLPDISTHADHNFFCCMFAMMRLAQMYYIKLQKLGRDCEWSSPQGTVMVARLPNKSGNSSECSPAAKKARIQQNITPDPELVSSLTEYLSCGAECLSKIQMCADSHNRNPDAFLLSDWLLQFATDCMSFEGQTKTLTDVTNARIQRANDNAMNDCERAYWYFRLFVSSPSVVPLLDCISAQQKTLKDNPRLTMATLSSDSKTSLKIVPVDLSLHLGVEYILEILHEKVVLPNPSNNVLGVALILSQFQYPKWAHITKAVVGEVKKHGLEFTLFHKYVTLIDVIEMIAFVQESHPKLRLVINPDIESPRKGAQNTRHSTKGAKEEIRATLVAIASKSHPPVAKTVAEFIVNHKNIVIAACNNDLS